MSEDMLRQARASRRQLLKGAAAMLLALVPRRVTATEAAAPDAPAPAPTAETAPPYSEQYKEALKKILGAAEARAERVTVDIPVDVENGNIVPYKLDVESPMTEADRIERLHLLSTENPQPLVATFHFTSRSGKAAVTGRMRLARTQDVVAVAETAKGEFLIGHANVKVAIGGCGSE